MQITGSDVELSGNVVRGSEASAIGIGPFDVLTGSRNRVTGNDLRNFQPGRSRVAFGKGSADNVCSGQQFIIKLCRMEFSRHVEGCRVRCYLKGEVGSLRGI